MPKMFGEIYKKCMNSLTFWHPAVPQFLIAAIFLVDCKELKLAKNTQINQLFQFLNLICIYCHVFYGLTRMLMSKINESAYTITSFSWSIINSRFTVQLFRGMPVALPR